jgi:Ethylbenzene dehydrogenase
MRKIGLIIGMTALAEPALAADLATIDWSKVPVASVTLFYPGQSSHEWLRTSDHRSSRSVLDGGACTTCHRPREKALGDEIVKRGRLEPTPVKGKNGTIDLKFQAAYDSKNAYLRLQWKTLNPYPGSEHQYLRFDGKEWKIYGYPKLDKVVQDGAQPGIYEDR